MTKLNLCYSYIAFLQNKDALARLSECFVRMQIEQITADDMDFDGRDIRNHIYNPNEMNEPDLNLMNLFKPLADDVLNKAEQGDPLSSIETQQHGQRIRNKYDNIFHRIEPVNHERFRQILLQKSSRYDSTMDYRKIGGMKFKEVENVSDICGGENKVPKISWYIGFLFICQNFR